MRFQTKVLIALALPILVSLVMATVTIWSTSRSNYLLVRARHAHVTLGGFRQLKLDVEIYMRGQTESLLTGLGPQTGAPSREPVIRALVAARQAIASEVAAVEQREIAQEIDELRILAEVERQFAGIHDTFTRIRAAISEGRMEDAGQLLVRNRAERNTLSAVLAELVTEEIEEAEEADEEAARLSSLLRQITLAAEGLVLLLGIAISVWLTMRLRARFEALVKGTQALAAGRLSHRVEVVGRDEFAGLAENVNRMAAELEENQKALREAQGSLEATVAQRTEQLREAHAQLEQADRVRRRFFADISHELRTPLTVIRGEAEVALRAKIRSDDEYRVALQRVIEQVTNLARLVDDLLLIARTENSAVAMRRQAVALVAVVQEACRDAGHAAAKKGIVIDMHSDVRDAVVLGDRGRLRQLFLILLDNAVHYSRREERIAVNILSSPQGVAVQVVDRGIGIPSEELSNVFDRFYRASNVIDQRIEGTGLGLPIAKAIVEAHDGRIGIESELDHGTTITVSLPNLNEIRAIA